MKWKDCTKVPAHNILHLDTNTTQVVWKSAVRRKCIFCYTLGVRQDYISHYPLRSKQEERSLARAHTDPS